MSREELRSAAAKEVDRWEQAISDELLRLFDRQEAVVVARLQGTKARKHTRHWEPPGERPLEVKQVIDPQRWLLDAAGSVAPIIKRLFAAVYKRVSTGLVDGAPEAPEDEARTAAAIETRLDLVSKGVETAVEEVQTYIAAEEVAGTPMPQIVDGVRALYEQRKPTWAGRIATVSAVGSINQAALFAAADRGASAKQWVSSRDDRVRDTHEKADRQVRLLDERFRLGGIPTHPKRSLLMFPGDPSPSVPLDEVINCRCTLVFSPPRPGRKGDEGFEVKDRVRTAAGAEHYGQPIGSTIRRDKTPALAPAFSAAAAAPTAQKPAAPARPARPAPAPGRKVGTIGGLPVDDASADPSVRALIAKYSKPGENPDPATTSVFAMRDSKGRVGAYVVWQSEDGPKPRGTIIDVSVHPNLKGRGIGDELVALAMTEDPTLVVQTRPKTSTPTGAAAPKKPSKPPRPIGPDGLPVIESKMREGDQPGPSGDFEADVERIERLQKAYAHDRADTAALFSRYGRYSPEREAQHKELIAHFLNKPGVKAERRLLIMAGLPGAGKTTTLNSDAGQDALGVDLADYVVVNGDDVKEEMIRRGMVPDYPGLSPEESGSLIQAEAFEVASSLMRKAARRGLNYAYDTTLRRPNQYDQAAGPARGYETTLMLVDVPLPVAKQRARDRYMAGDRYVPGGFIDGQKASSREFASASAENFEDVKHRADRWVHVDNSGAAPVVVADGVKERRRAERD